MKASYIREARLANQQITSTSFNKPEDMVKWFGAMQAQDLPMAKWAVGARLPGSTEADIDIAIDKSKVIRTHILRPTWHLVAAEDIYWMLELTAPQVKAQTRSRDKQLELTEKIYSRSNRIIEKTLTGGKHLTRRELVLQLNQAKIKTDEYRSGHLLLRAELEGVICSGPFKGQQPTYALLNERIPSQNSIPKDEALGKLAQRYFLSHGPATALDFGWWSGLSVKDVTRAIEIARWALRSNVLEGQTYWFSESILSIGKKDRVCLLPAFDEYIISYKNRSAAIELEYQGRAFTTNGIFKPLIVINGKVVGIWKKLLLKDDVVLEADFFYLRQEVSAAVSIQSSNRVLPFP